MPATKTRTRRPAVAIADAVTVTEAMIAPHRAVASETWLAQTLFAWEGGTSQGVDCALVCAAAPLAAYQDVTSNRPSSAVGQPILTVLPAGYFGSVTR